MFTRFAYRLPLLAVLTILAAPACSRSRPRDSELPPLEAPVFLDEREEAFYLLAQMYRYARSAAVEDDMNFDSWDHVQIQFLALLFDSVSWYHTPTGYDEWIREQLARTPEVFRYNGARKNAVALGLLAYSVWRRDPKREHITIEQLNTCARRRPGGQCRVKRRTLVLHRMMLMAEHADGSLYESLQRKMPPVRMRPAPPPPSVKRPMPAPEPDAQPDQSGEPDHEQP